MTSKRRLGVICVCLAAIAALIAGSVWLSSGENDVALGTDTTPVKKDASSSALSGVVAGHSAASDTTRIDADALIAPPTDLDLPDLADQAWQPSEKAVSSLKDAMQYGDPRTPRLAESKPRELPSEQELADPKLYLEYEARQKAQVYQSFIKASAVKIAEIEDAIAMAERDGGVTEAQLEEGRRKLEALKRSREEVLAEHPEAAEDSTAEPVEEGGEF